MIMTMNTHLNIYCFIQADSEYVYAWATAAAADNFCKANWHRFRTHQSHSCIFMMKKKKTKITKQRNLLIFFVPHTGVMFSLTAHFLITISTFIAEETEQLAAYIASETFVLYLTWTVRRQYIAPMVFARNAVGRPWCMVHRVHWAIESGEREKQKRWPLIWYLHLVKRPQKHTYSTAHSTQHSTHQNIYDIE